MAYDFLAKIVSLQFALFFKEVIDRPDLEFADINTNLMNIFDAVPSVMPIPRELPPDVPMVTQRSESNEYICNISRARIDLHFNRVSGNKSNVELLSDFNAKVNGLLSYVLKKRGVVRFGMICRYFHESDSPVEIIKRKYLKDVVDEVEELSLRYNKKSTLLSWEINDVVEIVAAKATVDGTEKNGIFIQRDINNTPQVNKTINEESLKKISKTYSERITEKSIEELLK